MAVREHVKRVAVAASSGQSHLIVGVVLLSFLVWVTLRGNLGKYLTYLGFGTPALTQAQQQQAAGAAGSVIGGSAGAGIGTGVAGAIGGALNLPSLPQIPPIGTPPFFPGN